MRRVLLIGLLLGVIALAVAACGGAAAPTASAGQAAQPTTAGSNAPAPGTSPTEMPAQMPTDTPVPAPTIAPPTSAPAASTNPLDAILKAEQQRLSKPVHAQIQSTDSSTNETRTIVIESQPPDRFHFQGTGQDMIIIRNQGTWMKQGDKWIKSPMDLSALIDTFFDPKAIEEISKAVKTSPPQFVGPDQLGGRPMLVYSYTTTTSIQAVTGGGSATQVTSNSKMWVGLDGLPYQIISDTPSTTKQGATNHTVITYDYSSPIDIQAPTP